MHSREHHRQEVEAFLRDNFSGDDWSFSLPQGSGHETYFAEAGERAYFVKLGVQTAPYRAMAAIGFTPEVLAAGVLEDGTTVLVQPRLQGRTPTRADYRDNLARIATVIGETHRSSELRHVLPEAVSELHSAAAMQSLDSIRARWEKVRPLVPREAAFVDRSLEELADQIRSLAGSGLVASHNDICNANWLISNDGHFYLIDLDSMSLDDPAVDVGATLWWYYPPALRPRFLAVVGYANDEAFRSRMRLRMAMHCLSILLPRDRSFDQFDPASFGQWLADFKAALAGGENPQGYDDSPQGK